MVDGCSCWLTPPRVACRRRVSFCERRWSSLPCIALVNKIDRSRTLPEEVVDEIYDLFLDLDANDQQIEFPFFTSSRVTASRKRDRGRSRNNLTRYSNRFVETIPAPGSITHDSLQLLVANIDYNPYVGRLAIGRIFSGEIAIENQDRRCKTRPLDVQNDGVKELYVFEGLKRRRSKCRTGEIVALAGFDNIKIGETITSSKIQSLCPLSTSTNRRSR